MPPIKRSAEDAALKEDSTAKRARVGATEPSHEFKRRLGSLLPELQLNKIRQVAYQPDRRQALAGLNWLLEDNPHFKDLIENTTDLRESREALQRHPGVESRYVALCRDVVSGIPVKDALRQNGPLPKDDNLMPQDVASALQDAGPPELAPLAEEFSGRQGAIDVTVLKGVACRAASTSTLRRANLEEAATLAKAFSRHADIEFIVPLTMLGSELPDALPQANLQQVAKLADAYGMKDGANYANRAAALLPQAEAQMYTSFVNSFGRSANRVIAKLASTVAERHTELLPQANIQQFATLADAFSSHGDPNSNSAMERLASELTMRRDDLLPRASAEQLATMKKAFDERNGQNCPQVLAKINEMEQRSLNDKPPLKERDRERGHGL